MSDEQYFAKQPKSKSTLSPDGVSKREQRVTWKVGTTDLHLTTDSGVFPRVMFGRKLDGSEEPATIGAEVMWLSNHERTSGVATLHVGLFTHLSRLSYRMFIAEGLST